MKNKPKRIVVKIGSGIVTVAKGPRHNFFKKMSDVVSQLQKQGHEILLVSSGAIACGMDILKIKSKPKSLPKKQAVAAIGQPQLMGLYSTAFDKNRLKVAQILLTRDNIENSHQFLTARQTLNELLAGGHIPIINENDSVAVEEIKFGDNDQLSAMVAHLVKAHLLIILTDIDGLYDADPRTNQSARHIPVVEVIDDKLMALAKGTLSAKSTGGMLTKLKAAQIAAKHGIGTWIVRGENPEIIQDLLQGQAKGTYFVPQKTKTSNRSKK